LIYSFFSDNALDDEKELHIRFGGKRVKGEWFNLDQNDIEWIKEHYKKANMILAPKSILNCKVAPFNPDNFVQKSLFDEQNSQSSHYKK